MDKRTYLQLLQNYVTGVNALLLQRTPATPAQRQSLRSQADQLLHYAAAAGQREAKGPAAHVAAAAARRASQPFTVTWRASGQVQHLVGWQALCALTGLQRSSLRVMLSMGSGAFTRAMLNANGDPDVAEIRKG